ncbi:D-alanyl-D-alanine carboxypeptidase family protein [Siminovitchia sp. 179-K 8D1 HS]|uniref:M15 family metallopeptidase n=1 Tax=Siminovitchia sp. 179-K 8D1 HS TaxID=3142385 RepID=UPI0039A3DEDF
MVRLYKTMILGIIAVLAFQQFPQLMFAQTNEEEVLSAGEPEGDIEHSEEAAAEEPSDAEVQQEENKNDNKQELETSEEAREIPNADPKATPNLEEKENHKADQQVKSESPEKAEPSSFSAASLAPSLRGVALQNPTKVYMEKKKDSQILKSYKQGHILHFQVNDGNWYSATVYVGGKKQSGYILKSDVDLLVDSRPLEGYALKQSVQVYEQPTQESKTLKKYNFGQLLKYRAFSSKWHEATVIIEGKAKTGFIKASDVGYQIKTPFVNGIALANQTHVYDDTSRNAKKLKTYKKGHILKYRTYNSDWFMATVYQNGKGYTGFIDKNDVETAVARQTTLKGVGIKNPTRVFSTASTNSKVLKNYKYGSILKYKTFTSNWYQATVYVGGKAQSGYIYAGDTGALDTKLKGYALANPVYIYSEPNRKSKKLKSYAQGHLLQYRAYNANWHQATVYVNGKAQNGYLNVHDAGPDVPILKGYAQLNPTYVYNKPSKSSGKLKAYKIGHLLQYRPYNSTWHTAAVYINGKRKTGYIYNKDVGPTKKKANSPTYINGVLIVSKNYPLPASHAPGENPAARKAFNQMAKDAKKSGFRLTAFSTYRSYSYQKNLFDRYARKHGVEAANRYSAKAGQSEHQTGLAFDVGEVGKEHLWAEEGFEHTNASKWIAKNAHKYGFIVRYPKGKEHITGYIYEPWHLRYLGVNLATKVYNSGLTLEEYLGIY